ncbi:uncharacterized protein CANTADRAFT_24960 [Suhomyces tanzawaensis NRRL Y-17324]|uniref:DNA-dependent ATPase n=1 Tax=Suhomyces tanzawaensis NRRL Y-17324 TaxID=984487 RepID=A0A1E4SSQ6_9ASCO|nr:uncharacterized protein CANTADRAFT_24960 [Suhomyces tanzawaensis NRRL Y-17324]ODV82457.1 hypothetical protein CANTADRAFT_24960 [Suhomyces tanzawaensis NRRL Y-17324]
MTARAAFKPPRFVRKDGLVPLPSPVPPLKSPNAPKPAISPSITTDSLEEAPRAAIPVKRKAAVRLTTKRPALHRPAPSPAVTSVTSTTGQPRDRYVVQWRKRSTKKNKTWEGDGHLTVTHADGSALLVFKDSSGKQLGKKSVAYKPELLDEIIAIGQFELEVDCKIDSIEDVAHESTPAPVPMMEPTPFKKVAPPIVPGAEEPVISNNVPEPEETPSILMPNPPNVLDFKPVELDHSLASKLRPHQVEGVRFMYECLLGFRDFAGTGCLLADEMGLGKTLMTITIIYTLYKQSPFRNIRSLASKILICCPVTLINNWKQEFKKWLGLNKIQILTLGGNSGNASISDKQNLVSFGKLNVYQVLIINYEKVSTYFEELSAINFDLLVCDEGHRLKSKTNKVLNHLTNLKIPKKILLTGTPIQNDLVEFFTIINFLNPGVLGDFKSFQRDFINPILRSRDVNCYDPDVKKTGEIISNRLITITKQFILRRTQSILSSYLTSRTDVVLFVPPTEVQTRLFDYITRLKKFNQLLNDSSNQAFTLINLFKKICNSSALLKDDQFFTSLTKDDTEFQAAFPSSTLSTSSGKINILIPLLLETVALDEKVVLISNYTQTLDLLELILNKLNLKFLRLDGSTPKNLRSKLVSEFNKASAKAIPIFLLSSKSGGMGINLVGASRLILFDNDWNPSVDLQSMARIHRDGQSKPCFIYRILTTGCIDEKIFQRQLMKNNLSSKFLDDDSDSKSDVFDSVDLKNLFEIDKTTNSNTHDLLECDCEGKGDNASFEEPDTDEDEGSSLRLNSWVSALDLKKQVEESKQASAISIKHALHDYIHYDPRVNTNVQRINDPVLCNILQNKNFMDRRMLSYIMMKASGND